MNRIIKFIATILFVFIGITGGMIYTSREHIPENAKIIVIEEYQIWIPNIEWADKIFQEQASQDINANRIYKSKVESNYFEVKKGRYKGFQIPASWKEENGYERIVWERKVNHN